MTRRVVDSALVEEQRLAKSLQTIDFQTVWSAAAERHPGKPAAGPCRICNGRFGPVLDSTELIRGISFLTAHAVVDGALVLEQVSSTRHHDDLDSVPPMDAIAAFETLSRAESFLWSCGDSRFPEIAPNRRGWVTIEKQRRGRGHGIQTVTLHPREPKSLVRERAHIARHGAGLAALMETRGPTELLVGEFRGGLAAAVPMAAKRAFETVIWFRPSARGGLSDLTGNQRWGLAQAVREITGALRLELGVRGLPERYRWQLVAAPDLEPYLRITTPPDLVVHDGPSEWVERLRSHIGVE